MEISQDVLEFTGLLMLAICIIWGMVAWLESVIYAIIRGEHDRS